MADQTIQITAPARLHFGLLSFGTAGVRRYGGVGVMVREPSLRLTISPADRFEVTGPLADRARHFALLTWRRTETTAEPPCRIDIAEAPAAHTGLGSGTQLAMSVAAGLNSFSGHDNVTAEELARRVDRGGRSAVGLHGFVQGGLIAESGKLDDDEISPLLTRISVPDGWRFVLVTPDDLAGIHGAAEREAFAHLPPVPAETTSRLCSEAFLNLIPAVAQGRFDEAAESLYRYGRAAGICFAARQGGPYASPRLQRLVELIRTMGVSGVGQSSWGPTLFALLPSEEAARRFVDRLSKHPEARDSTLLITPAANQGACVRVRQIA